MPIFVYLPSGLRINLCHVIDANDTAGDQEPIVDIRMTGDSDSDPSISLTGPDREVFLKALSKLTPKELT